MKVRELIAELQKADPTGEVEVSIDGRAPFFVSNEPAYYDGALQTLIRDAKGSVVGVRIVRGGNKIRIRSMDYEDVIWDQEYDGECVIEYDSKHTRRAYEERVNQVRAEFRAFMAQEEN